MELYSYFRSSALFYVRIALNLKHLSYMSACPCICWRMAASNGRRRIARCRPMR
ncbi:hypothetical protein B0O95_102286 [Mycetohabitans endofungorum]|uniref:Uncharacterized protein n=1 Tax=Mycetohabitans endofungorum TaxID=417203 RepID=A0A2P5KDX5_9BURK|nr:hypothetical protein B0O95_102286 [Mycetohabitans endofungorum]